MTKIKIGINGFGRIGRNVLKLAVEREKYGDCWYKRPDRYQNTSTPSKI